MDLVLVVREGAQVGRVFTVSRGDRKTIGRAPDCDIRLPDQGVSRRHCTIENVGAVLRVVDLESANGSFINGQLVERGSLGPGDQLAVGPTILECRARPTAPDRAPGEATLAYREEGTTTVVRKVVDTQYPGMEALAAAGKPEDLDDLQRAQRNLATAYQVSKMLANAPGLEKLLDEVIDSIFAAINADRAALLLQDRSDGSDELRIVASRSRTGEDSDLDEISVSRTVVQDVLENAASSLSRDASADARYKAGESIIQQKIRSVMCAPVSTDDSVIGVLYADSRSLTGAFAESDLELLALIGNQAGVAIHRAQLIAQLEKFFFDTIRAIVATIDAKDGYTHRHSERVADFAAKIATELGRTDEEIEVVKLSALLHDVGKVGVPEAILNKPGKLTKEEFDEIKKHPVHGVNILGHIESPRFKEILPGVRHHHEKWDGSGYPDGLSGETIPFLGRLLAVADVLDALSSDRSYRKGLGFDKSVEIIRQDAGSHFDPDVAAAAAELHSRGELEVLPEWIEPESDPMPTKTLDP
ncbi:MAG: HD domain-containing protein [Gemmatimonadetes bacterium]|nr:HD domain-containing protein [Gemmatimonadota bacterium]NIO33358.1 HD domain-containing protein [Gemmatimonadota bacterium]